VTAIHEPSHAPGSVRPRQVTNHSSSLSKLANRITIPLLTRVVELERAFSPQPEGDGGPPGYRGFFSALYCNAEVGLSDLLTFLYKLEARFGGGEKMLPVRFNLLGTTNVLVTNPRHIHQVFRDNEHFSASSDPQVVKRFKDLLGFNLVSADHELWGKVRPRTAAVLNGRPLSKYGEIMRAVMAEAILPTVQRSAEIGAPVDIFETMLEFSSRVAFQSFMGLGAKDIPDHLHPTLSRLFGHVRRYVMELGLPLWIPTAGNNDFFRDRSILRDFLRPHIDTQQTMDTMLGSIARAHTKRLPAAQFRNRILEILTSSFTGGDGLSSKDPTALEVEVQQILSRDEDVVYSVGKNLLRAGTSWAKETKRTLLGTEEELQVRLESALCESGEIDREIVLQEMVTNLIGSAETTIVMMTWGLYYLSKFPEAQERLHHEAVTGEGLVPLVEISTLRERWPYLFNAMREVLRIASPAALFNRPVIADVDLDGYFLKKGTRVWGAQFITHLSPHVWEDPESFKPERFELPVQQGAFFPFTLGPRTCVGMNYAYLEAAVALLTLTKHFRYECLTTEVGYDFGLTCRPDRPVLILFRNR
jgi:cytochrome P450